MSSGTSGFANPRGPSAGFRFTIYALLAIALMFFDQRGGWLERARYGLAAAAYPLHLAIDSPSAAVRWVQEALQSRDELRSENLRLQKHTRELEILQLRLAYIERENAELRALRKAVPPLIEKWLSGEVIRDESSSQRQRLLLNRGSVNGVFKGQAVLSSKGLVGQVLRVGPWSAEVIAITDPEHAVPVQVQRNGLRTIAVGVGDAGALSLPYLPLQSDIRDDDLLETSGLGGVFPAGYPVARVIEVKRDGSSVLAQVKAEPFAALGSERELMFVWFKERHPAAPVGEAGGPAAQDAVAVTPPPAAPAPPTGDAPNAAATATTAPLAAPATAPAAAATAPATAAPAQPGPAR